MQIHRDIQIDVLRGIGIFFVVVGHICPGVIHKFIYLFHMPFFFFISGYLHKQEIDQKYLLKSKIISLLIPYFFYLALFSLPKTFFLLQSVITDLSIQNLLEMIVFVLKRLYGGRLLGGVYGVFWFITCLFITQQIFNFISNKLLNKSMVFFLCFVLYFIGFVNQIYFIDIKFPWDVNVCFCSIALYASGKYFGRFIFKESNNCILILAILMSCISFLLIYFDFEIQFDMKNVYYGYFAISPLFAISITLLIGKVSKGISTIRYISSILSCAGRASITIMFTHQFMHIGMIKFTKLYPWAASVFIFSFCILLHIFLGQFSLTRAFFMGSKKDFKVLTNRYKGLTEA